MVSHRAEKYTLGIAFIIVVIVGLVYYLTKPKNQPLAGFNISFDYANPDFNGTVTLGQIYAANKLGITNFRWVESSVQEQSQSTLRNLMDIMYDNPDNPKNMQKYDAFFTAFINGTNRLMITVPYNSKNNPQEWVTINAKHVTKTTGKTLPITSPLEQFDFINRIEFSLMQNQLENTGSIQYPLSNHLIVALYAEAANQKGTTVLATPDTAIIQLLNNRILPCLNFVQQINKKRQILKLRLLDIVFAMEVQPQVLNSLDDEASYEPYIFDLGNPAMVSRDYPMDNRTSQAYAWWSTSQYHHEKDDNVAHANITNLLQALHINSSFLGGAKGYISLGIYPIIWQVFNLKNQSEGQPRPAKQSINDYAKLVQRRVSYYQDYIKKYTNMDLLISEFGWPGSCGGMCRSSGCLENFEAMKAGSTHAQQKKEQCIMWKVFESLNVPKYYWTLGTDIRHSMCGNTVQQMISGPGDENGWRITDPSSGAFIC